MAVAKRPGISIVCKLLGRSRRDVITVDAQASDARVGEFEAGKLADLTADEKARIRKAFPGWPDPILFGYADEISRIFETALHERPDLQGAIVQRMIAANEDTVELGGPDGPRSPASTAVRKASDRDVTVRFTVPVAKVDADKRLVRGIATQELVDVHNEIVDYDSLKRILPGYRGNIREMHQPVAVGRAVDLIADDTAKALVCEAYVSKGAPSTWEKCLDGTLRYFSIGGTADRIATKKADGTVETRLYMTALNEISLVDSGACPTATIEVVKLQDGRPTVQNSCRR